MSIGHNHMPLEERIFSDPSVSVGDVLTAVASRVERQYDKIIKDLADTAKALSGNKDRLPETFGQADVQKGLDLLARMDSHSTAVTQTRETVLKSAEEFVASLKALCKPLDEGLAPLEKTLRASITPALERILDEHNADRTDAEAKLGSFTIRAASGAKATLVDGEDVEVISPTEVPREFCVPDPKLLLVALKEGKEVPGTAKKRKTSLRISTK